MSSAPRLAPSSLNWTPATPTLSEAEAEIVIVPETVEPLAGEVMEIDGASVSDGAPYSKAPKSGAEPEIVWFMPFIIWPILIAGLPA